MSTNEQTPLSQPTFAVRNTLGNEPISQDMDMPAFDAALREYCDRNYLHLLPIIAKKVHQENVQQEKLKAVKACLNFEEVSQHSESGTPSRRKDLRKRLGSRRVRSVSGTHQESSTLNYLQFWPIIAKKDTTQEKNTQCRKGRQKEGSDPRHDRIVTAVHEPRRCPESLRKKDSERKMVFKRLENGVFHMLGDKGKSMSAYSNESRRHSYHSSRKDTESCYQNSRSRGTEPASEKHHNKRASSHRAEALSESEGSTGGHWKSRSKKQRSSIEDDDLSQPWVCEETNLFTPRIRYFDLPNRTHMPSHVKTYDKSEVPEDHLKIFQAAAKVEHWAMPTWCHMFNSTLTGSVRVWFDDLPPESVDSYDDLKEAFLANFRQQKKCIKDLVEIYHIKQREGESTKDFVHRFRIERRNVKGAPEIMRIS
ncbi:reverse transcriptase domain-containing protein [Tanacetum coccineum]